MSGRVRTIRAATTADRRGFTLMELAVVMAIIVILAAVAIPALSGLTRVSSEGAARTALRSMFASCRSAAATAQTYVGVRFQQDKTGRSYAILLEYKSAGATASPDFPNGCPPYDLSGCDPTTGPYLTFVAAGAEPVLLPRGVEFAAGDLLAGVSNPDDPTLWHPQDSRLTVTDATSIVPATTFSVVFSASGQIVRKYVHVTQRRDGWAYEDDDPDAAATVRTWSDPVFNMAGGALFPPDVVDKGAKAGSRGDTDPDPQNEPKKPTRGPNYEKVTEKDTAVSRMSETSIWVYERDKRLEQTGLDAATCKPFSQYIQRAGSLISLNVYTGAPVNTQQ